MSQALEQILQVTGGGWGGGGGGRGIKTTKLIIYIGFKEQQLAIWCVLSTVKI